MSRPRRSLQRKYAVIFATLIGGAVLSGSAAELYAAYDGHQAALARSEIRFGRIPMSMSDHLYAADSWIWHRKGERKRVGASAPPIESGKA